MRNKTINNLRQQLSVKTSALRMLQADYDRKTKENAKLRECLRGVVAHAEHLLK